MDLQRGDGASGVRLLGAPVGSRDAAPAGARWVRRRRGEARDRIGGACSDESARRAAMPGRGAGWASAPRGARQLARPPGERPGDLLPGIAPTRRMTGRSPVQSTTVDAGPPCDRPAVDDERRGHHPAARRSRLRRGRRAGRRRWRRSSEGDRGRRRGPAGQGGPARGRRWWARRRPGPRGSRTPGRPAAPDVSPPARTARPGRRAAGPTTPIVAAWAASARSTATAFSGGRRLAANNRSMASGGPCPRRSRRRCRWARPRSRRRGAGPRPRLAPRRRRG